MFLSYRRARRVQSAELNITAFMNLMVALVPFLLVTAVFTQMRVLELNLPEAAESRPSQPPPQQLTLVIRSATLSLYEGSTLLQTVTPVQGRFELGGLSKRLAEVKQRRPTEDKITLLLEPDTPYDRLIQVMDAVRVQQESGTAERPLFPGISLGDAPPEAGR